MKEIILTQGYKTQVDDEHYEWLNQFKWFYNNGYACRHIGPKNKRVRIHMHRVVCGPPDNMLVDHIDGNPLNNQSANLRPVTRQQNAWNSRQKTKCGYRGVSPCSTNRWQAVFRKKYLGCFDSPEKAYQAWLEAAKVDEFSSIELLTHP